MNELPLVSVIMPYYNQAEFLLDAVRSVERQTYPHVELIVVDDCSPETPASELLEWRQMRNLKIVRHQFNFGAAASRNTAVMHSKGQLILPLDSDDYISEVYLEETVPVLLSDPTLGGVYTNVQKFGDRDILRTYNCQLPDHLTHGGPNTFLYRKAVFDSVGGYKAHLKYGEDFDFWISALSRGFKFHLHPQLLFFRRLQPNGKSNRKDWVKVMESLLKEHREVCTLYAEDFLAQQIETYWGSVRTYKQLYVKYIELMDLSQKYQQLYASFGKEGKLGGQQLNEAITAAQADPIVREY